MGENTNIQWTDHTHNPWRGCRKVAPECANCYIVTTPIFRFTKQTHGSVRTRAGEGHLREPYKWNAAAEAAGRIDRVFCLSLGDWLDDENVPVEWRARLLRTIRETRNLTWQLLTKRPKNWARLIKEAIGFHYETDCWLCDWLKDGRPPENVWIGVSAGADQKAALDIPAKVHFLSCEPMLRPLDTTYAGEFDWIIFGGESGPKARQCRVKWILDGLNFCL
jgi:protein gp37